MPTAEAGVRVIGVDSSAGMLEVCRTRAEEAGVAELLDLRLGDLRDPPVDERVPLVTCGVRGKQHHQREEDRRAAVGGTRGRHVDEGAMFFDVFAPSPGDIDQTHARWLEREPGIWERADWDEGERRLTLSVRGEAGEAVMTLSWLSVPEWQELVESAGFRVEARYGWFDRRPYAGGEDSVWIARRF